MTEPLIFEFSRPGRKGAILPVLDVPEARLPAEMLREELPLPEVSEVDVVRHYVRLSQLNYGVDTGFYPLGSCTMKYNPKVNERAARLPGLTEVHPYQPAWTVQGNLALMWSLQEMLKEISGFAGVSLQPAAGAQGEFTGILIMRAYHLERGERQRVRVLVPDSAHGTNPASVTMSGFQAVEIKSDARGNVDLDELRRHCDETVVGLMLTNPNTLGLFDEHLLEVAETIHRCGGLLYGDGANLNALLGIGKPGHMGFDVMHFNLHKTFSTPHGGGGPGSGPVGVVEKLVPYLPGPIAYRELTPACCEHPDHQHDEFCQGEQHEHSEECFAYELRMPEKSIGRMKSFYGNFGVFIRAYTYIRMLGAAGLRQVSEDAVLAANYLQARLKGVFPIPYGHLTCMHEFVAQVKV